MGNQGSFSVYRKFHWTLSYGTVNQLILSTLFNIHFNILSFLFAYIAWDTSSGFRDCSFQSTLYTLSILFSYIQFLYLVKGELLSDPSIQILLNWYSHPYAHHEGIRGSRGILPFRHCHYLERSGQLHAPGARSPSIFISSNLSQNILLGNLFSNIFQNDHGVYPQLPDFLYTNSSFPISTSSTRVAITESAVKAVSWTFKLQ